MDGRRCQLRQPRLPPAPEKRTTSHRRTPPNGRAGKPFAPSPHGRRLSHVRVRQVRRVRSPPSLVPRRPAPAAVAASARLAAGPRRKHRRPPSPWSASARIRVVDCSTVSWTTWSSTSSTADYIAMAELRSPTPWSGHRVSTLWMPSRPGVAGRGAPAPLAPRARRYLRAVARLGARPRRAHVRGKGRRTSRQVQVHTDSREARSPAFRDGPRPQADRPCGGRQADRHAAAPSTKRPSPRITRSQKPLIETTVRSNTGTGCIEIADGALAQHQVRAEAGVGSKQVAGFASRVTVSFLSVVTGRGVRGRAVRCGPGAVAAGGCVGIIARAVKRADVILAMAANSRQGPPPAAGRRLQRGFCRGGGVDRFRCPSGRGWGEQEGGLAWAGVSAGMARTVSQETSRRRPRRTRSGRGRRRCWRRGRRSRRRSADGVPVPFDEHELPGAGQLRPDLAWDDASDADGAD